MDISIIGGTGDEGFGLTLRLARAGHHVTIGSRSQEKGAASAEKARALVGGDANVDGTTNEAAAAAGVVIVTVPFEGQAEIYRTIKGAIEPGTIVVDCTSPLATAVGGRAWHVVRPWHGSAAEQAKAILDPGVRMVGAFHTISGEALQDLEHEMESDVLVCGTDNGGQGDRRRPDRGHPPPALGRRRRSHPGPDRRDAHRAPDLDQPDVQDPRRRCSDHRARCVGHPGASA